MEAFIQATDGSKNMKQIFIPKETLDHPFDLTLEVQDGKEFRAHRRVLSESTPFFEKMLNSDMREANEGLVRLEMVTGLCFRGILEFIYTGNVEITDEDNAQRLIEMADFFILPPLKALAESYLVTNLKLDISNSISIYVFAGRFRCEKLISHAINFIGANFTTIVKAKEFLDLSREEFKKCISSNKINVSTEEDVFEILLTWINHDKCERKQYFEELFREIKLVYLSRDFLESDVMTNDFVKDNERCMNLVQFAKRFSSTGPISYPHFSYKPRNSLETPVVVAHVPKKRNHLCYYGGPKVSRQFQFHHGNFNFVHGNVNFSEQ